MTLTTCRPCSTILYALLLACLALAPRAHAATYWVAPKGDDTWDGSRERPWGTIQRGVSQAKAGDTVLVRDGDYVTSAPIRFAHSGEEGKWIVLAAEPGASVVIDASPIRPANLGEASGRGAIDLRGATRGARLSYIRIEGLRIRQSHQFGIRIDGSCDHIEIRDCKIEWTFGPAIGAWNMQYLRVVGVRSHARQRAEDAPLRRPAPRVSPRGDQRGGRAPLRGGVERGAPLGQGGDRREGEERPGRGAPQHYVHDRLPRQALYADAWFGLLDDVEFCSNVVHGCEFGTAISVENRGAELRNVRFHHNVIYNNRASGFALSTWGADGPRSGIVFANNTLWHNGARGTLGRHGRLDRPALGPRERRDRHQQCLRRGERLRDRGGGATARPP